MASSARHDETPQERLKREKDARAARIAALPVKEVDLLHISRSPDKCRSYVELEWDWDTRIKWLVFGEASLRTTGDRLDGRWNVEARMGHNIADFEHDTCFALRLPLIGVQFEWADHHQFRFHGWVDPNAGEAHGHPYFHVPPSGYDPRKHPDTRECSGIYDEKKKLYCKWNDGKKHPIVPEGFYVPKFDSTLYKLVRGKRVNLILGMAPNEEDE